MLAAFLFRWRAVLIALVTVPVSLVAAALVLDLLGETFNAISFAGLAVAIAVVIDDAVVSAENVARRLRAQRADGRDGSTAEVVLQASHEMRSPLAYATLIALLAVVPLAIMEGRPGAFFEPLALAYALAVAASMLVALTLSPALSLMLFSRGSHGGRESPLLRPLAARYLGALSRVVHRPRAVLIAAAAAVVVGLALLPLLGTSLIPSFKDRDLLVRLDGEPGTSNPRMTRIATDLSRELRAIPGVDNVGAHVGRAVTGDQVVDVNSGELWVSIDSSADYDATVASIERCGRPHARRRSRSRQLLGAEDQGRRSAGPGRQGGLGQRPQRADRIRRPARRPRLRPGPGHPQARGAQACRGSCPRSTVSTNPRIELPVTQPTIEIETDLDRAQRFGVKPGDVRRAAATLVQGIQVGSVFEQQKVFDVVVKGVPATRNSVASVRNLLIDGPDGGHVRLSQVADVQVAPRPIVIERDAVSRHVDIVAGVSGRSLGSVATDIEDRLAKAQLPARISRRGAAGEHRRGAGRHADDRVRDRRGDRSLPAPAGRLQELASGDAGPPDPPGGAGGRRAGGADRRRSCRSDRCSASWRCSGSPPVPESC